MKKTRRTEINIETHRRTTIRFVMRHVSVHCEFCREVANVFALDEVAEALDMTLTEVCRAIGTGEFHLVKTKRDLPLVCGKSFAGKKKALMLTASPNQI